MAINKILPAGKGRKKSSSSETTKTSNTSEQGLKFRFDVSTFRLLGRELITDRITALFELVKNSYDANSDNVTVEFINVGNKSEESKIIISDDGLGMSYTDIKNKWMVIGTNSKRNSRLSPAPYYRAMVGKKGVGRFAVDKLGSTMTLRTKQKDSSSITVLQTDWKEYEKLSEQLDLFDSSDEKNDKKRKFFTDIVNKTWIEVENTERQGTTIEITSIRDPWSKEDVTRAYKELSKLVSPIRKLPFPFQIIIIAKEYKDFEYAPVKSNAIEQATKELTLSFSKEENYQETLRYIKGELKVIRIPFRSFGPIGFKLYYFNQKGKRQFKEKNIGENIDGIKIYRDGVITTPFAEYEAQDIKKRDVLGIDKRRYSSFFDKVSSSDLIGYVDITDKDNPEIIDSTNRQDFVDNPEYRELKNFIIDQLVELENYLKGEREQAKKTTKSNLKTAKEELSSFSNIVLDLKKSLPSEYHPQFNLLETQSRKLKIDIDRGIKEFNNLEEELVRQENLYLSLMSLQDYSVEISHVVRTALYKISGAASFIYRRLPNPDLDASFKRYAKEIYDEMQNLGSMVDFLLSYAKSNIDFVELDIKALIEKLFKQFKHIFDKEGIQTIVEITDTLRLIHNEKFIEDIFENLISNSIKAVKENSGEKYIKCTGTANKNELVLLFSDNGYGIEEPDRHRVFNIYFTNTAEQGGAGIGLYVVRTRVEAMKGTVEIVENEFKPTGATFKITLPFDKTKKQ